MLPEYSTLISGLTSAGTAVRVASRVHACVWVSYRCLPNGFMRIYVLMLDELMNRNTCWNPTKTSVTVVLVIACIYLPTTAPGCAVWQQKRETHAKPYQAVCNIHDVRSVIVYTCAVIYAKSRSLNCSTVLVLVGLLTHTRAYTIHAAIISSIVIVTLIYTGIAIALCGGATYLTINTATPLLSVVTDRVGRAILSTAALLFAPIIILGLLITVSR